MSNPSDTDPLTVLSNHVAGEHRTLPVDIYIYASTSGCSTCRKLVGKIPAPDSKPVVEKGVSTFEFLLTMSGLPAVLKDWEPNEGDRGRPKPGKGPPFYSKLRANCVKSLTGEWRLGRRLVSFSAWAVGEPVIGEHRTRVTVEYQDIFLSHKDAEGQIGQILKGAVPTSLPSKWKTQKVMVEPLVPGTGGFRFGV